MGHNQTGNRTVAVPVRYKDWNMERIKHQIQEHRMQGC